MVNPFLMISGIGMMLFAIFSVLYWRGKGIASRYFLYGAGVWTIAIILKTIMDLTITTPIFEAIANNYSIDVVIAALGLYIGLRTGLFESGFTYITAVKTRLKRMEFNEAVAFGIGFGALEAFILGLFSFTNILLFVIYPEMEAMLDITQLQQINMSSWLLIVPVLERASALLIHIFATLLVIYSIRSEKIIYLFASVIFRTFVDGSVTMLSYYIAFTEIGIILTESVIVILALIGLFGSIYLKERFAPVPQAETMPKAAKVPRKIQKKTGNRIKTRKKRR